MTTPASPIAATSAASESTTSIAPAVKGIRVFTNSKPHDFPTASDAYFDKEGNLSICARLEDDPKSAEVIAQFAAGHVTRWERLRDEKRDLADAEKLADATK